MKGHLERGASITAHFAATAGAVLLSMMAIATCSAQEIKGHDWPCVFTNQEIPDLEIPVVMDVVEVYKFLAGASSVRLERVDEDTYRGCSSLVVICTFDLTIDCTIEPTGVVPGDYSCSVDPPEISAPYGVATLCAEVKNARFDNLPAGKKVLQVAVIKIRVTPK